MSFNSRRFEVSLPLRGFHWKGDDLEFVPGIHIRRLTTTPDLTLFDKGLTPWELGNLRNETSHWLTFDVAAGEEPSSGAVSNLFLMSLWLAKPTKSHVALRLEIGRDAAHLEAGITRLLDRFQYVKGSTHAKFEDDDLRNAASYFQTMLTITADTRLFMGQILTLNACWQSHWHAAISLFSTATETLLTYSEAFGLTKRLAVAYACVLNVAKDDRDIAFSDFRECYRTRSDIIHGRSLRIPKADRLAKVVRWQNLLRNLWVHILRNPSLITILNGNDAHREAHLTSIINGYVPPP